MVRRVIGPKVRWSECLLITVYFVRGFLLTRKLEIQYSRKQITLIQITKQQ